MNSSAELWVKRDPNSCHLFLLFRRVMSQKRSKLLSFVSTVPPSYESKENQTFAICFYCSAELWVKRDPNFCHLFSDWCSYRAPMDPECDHETLSPASRNQNCDFFRAKLALNLWLYQKKYWQMELLRQHFHPFSSFNLYLGLLEKG